MLHIEKQVLSRVFTDPSAPAELFRELGEKNLTVEILVNNAGIGLLGRFCENELKTEMAMIEKRCGYGRIEGLAGIAIVNGIIRGEKAA